MSRILKWTGLVLAAGVLLTAILLLFSGEDKGPPLFTQVRDTYKKSEALLLDRYGQVIQEMRFDKKSRRLEWAELKGISPAFIQAVLQVEDRRFYQHRGVDWSALASSVIHNFRSPKKRGASTLSMQLVPLIDKRLKPKGERRSLKEKWDQILAARAVEMIWTKEQILEAYLNLISFRTELQGISAASRGLFNKDPSGLNHLESLILASLITSPNASLDRIIRRACFYGRSLDKQTSDEAIKTLATERLGRPYHIKPAVSLAPHVARRLLKNGVTQCRSTLDGRLQRLALETLNQTLSLLKESQVADGAVVVIDNKTGEILVYVGNSGQTASAFYTDGLIARRQAGSTLKPFLYGLAIEKGLLTAASLLDDSPLQIPTPTGLYVPQNYDNLFKGLVSVRTALSSSINIPAVRTLQLVGLDPFLTRLKHLGLEGLSVEEEYYGYSLALGSADITLLALANAYRTLANEGVWSELKLSFDQPEEKPKRIMDKKAAHIISHILSDREARSSTFGLENPLATRFWTAVKTGTSKEMRDNWCLGFSEKYTVGVWVGNFSGEPMKQVSGVSGAAPIWLEIMNTLHANRSSKSPQIPTGVILAKVSFHQDLEPAREELFLRGTEPLSQVRVNSHYQKPRIIYPAHETLIAIDPEIPEVLQRVPFRFQPDSNHYDWVLNNRKVGSNDPFFLWKPERGQYVLSIVNQHNQILDSVEFQVR
ncbi:MAG: penicillin-binding protein 1C [Desulfobacca sp.]|nr:penicillin-binding protein 1C [Desulfobacca sp.]